MKKNSHRQQSGSTILVGVFLIAMISATIITLIRTVDQSIKLVKTLDYIQEDREDNYNWLTYLENSELCSSLTVVSDSTNDPYKDPSDIANINPRNTAPNPAKRMALSLAGGITSASPFLLKDEKIYPTLGHVDYVHPSGWRRSVLDANVPSDTDEKTLRGTTRSFRFEQVSTLGRGYAQIKMSVFSHWEESPGVYYEPWGTSMVVLATPAGTVVQCLGYSSPAHMCLWSDGRWNITTNTCEFLDNNPSNMVPNPRWN